MITVTINGNRYEAGEGSTILDIARKNGVDIPTLCYMEGVSDIGSCRMCMVECEGYGMPYQGKGRHGDKYRIRQDHIIPQGNA